MIYIGENNINIYVGSAQVDKVYLGNMEVWSNGWGGLGFTAKSADATVSLSNVGGNTPVLEYSTDGITWTSWDYSAISVASGSSVYFRGDNLSGFSKSDAYSCFSLSGTFVAKGNVMSLIDSVNFNSIKDIPNDYCFKQLFINCSGLTIAPKLPATGLTKYCYEGMFRGCSGLVKEPKLPAATLTEGCYYGMFRDCTSLANTPTLPATTLALNCYRDMFRGCYGLTGTTELPATALTDGCYNSMFLDCTGLTSSPSLQALTLADGCYAYMFYNCSSLNNIKCNATDISAVGCTTDWVQGVAATGDFFPNVNMTGWTTGVDGIPSGWSVVTIPYLTFTCIEDGGISMTNYGSNTPNIEYSKNSSEWITWDYSNIPLVAGDNVKMRGVNENISIGGGDYSKFTMTGKIAASGNLMTLFDFSGSTTTIGGYGIYKLFYGCTSLTSAPDILATTTTGIGGLGEVFCGCTNMVTPPEISLTTVSSWSLGNMFDGCTSLVSAPTLYSKNLVTGCYKELFKGCTNLSHITCLAESNISSNTVENWVSGVAVNGTFVKSQNASSWGRGNYGIPNGWTVEDYTE